MMRLLTGTPASSVDRDRATINIAAIVLTGLLMCISVAALAIPLFALLSGDGGQLTAVEIVYGACGVISMLIIALLVVRSRHMRR
ncbi:hypothetical protein [Streptomyces albidus (ex Kaewkla and Franco 2022)]|uniref:hypothetical protein n=1 Tax=Streptomyces albidus (ex Kaewkla and Franco 2022) TaxID=722709 RepID=UPI0015EF84B1|nr:hypothetical protein [Streptomyces albidus (ex Kaewkla and Franco 2022)]